MEHIFSKRRQLDQARAMLDNALSGYELRQVSAYSCAQYQKLCMEHAFSKRRELDSRAMLNDSFSAYELQQVKALRIYLTLALLSQQCAPSCDPFSGYELQQVSAPACTSQILFMEHGVSHEQGTCHGCDHLTSHDLSLQHICVLRRTPCQCPSVSRRGRQSSRRSCRRAYSMQSSSSLPTRCAPAAVQ